MTLLCDTPSGLPVGPATGVVNPAVLATQLVGLMESLGLRLADSQAEPACTEARARFEEARRELVLALNGWPRRERGQADWTAVRELIARLAASGLQDAPPAPGDAVVLARLHLADWTGLVALMVLMPAWRCVHAPRLAQVPDAWWGSYAEWLFTQPQGFSLLGDAECFSRHIHRHLPDLATWVQKNAGSVAVSAAVHAYLRVSNLIQLYFSAGDLRELAELRAKIFKRIYAEKDAPTDLFALPREGRRLRVGFVNYTTIPSFEQLDPARFEVTLFICRELDSPLETYCRAKVAAYVVLSTDRAEQLAALRAADLDVLVFGTNVTAVINEVTLLALHRVAPLQVVNNSSCITSGMPTVDMYVSGELTEAPEAATHFSERLGLLPGPAHAFNYEADRQVPVQEWSKSALGIPEEAFLFVSAANYYKVIPEMRESWARLLAAIPGSRLLLHPFNPNWSSAYPIKRFCAEFEAVLTRHGVDHNRLVVSTMKLPSRADVSALMGVGDLYLDTAPFGGVNSLVDPLEMGVPVVAWEVGTMRARMGSALLRCLGLTELIATDEASYERIALSLAGKPEWRAEISGRIKAAMERGPLFLDSLAASDAFGDLLEAAYDEVVEIGGEAFRKRRTPVRARRATPLSRDQRWAHGKQLLADARPERAVAYLLAALQQDDGTAALWLDVAQALRANGQHNDAIVALESALRLDETLYAGWALLTAWAEQAGNTGLADHARTVMAELRPGVSPTANAATTASSEHFF